MGRTCAPSQPKGAASRTTSHPFRWIRTCSRSTRSTCATFGAWATRRCLVVVMEGRGSAGFYGHNVGGMFHVHWFLSSMTRFCWRNLPWNLSKIWVWKINFLLMWPFASSLVEHLKLPTLVSFILSLILHTRQATKSKDEGGDFCNLVGRQFTVFLGNKPLKPDL